jgi:hypothetical protein
MSFLSALFSKFRQKPNAVPPVGSLATWEQVSQADRERGNFGSGNIAHMPEGAPVPSIVNGYVMLPMPIPPEECLLDMAYFAREKKGPVAIQMTHEISGDFIDLMLESQRAETSVRHKTEKAGR